MKIFLTTILIIINLFSQDIDTNLQLTTQEKEFIEKETITVNKNNIVSRIFFLRFKIQEIVLILMDKNVSLLTVIIL